MLKKLKLGLLLLCLPLSAMAAQFEVGNQYTVIRAAKTPAPEVKEFFSFYCPHCFKFETVAHAIEANLPANVEFEKSHVNFLGGISRESQSNITKAYLVAKKHGKDKAITEQIFQTIHLKNNQLTNVNIIRELFKLNDIDNMTFDSDWNSKTINDQASDMLKSQQRYSKLGALTGVPTFIVNGKYKINHNVISDQTELNELIDYLLKL